MPRRIEEKRCRILHCIHVTFATANSGEDKILPDTDVKQHVHEGRNGEWNW